MYDRYVKGEIARLKAELRALEKDCVVCYPQVECRYDSILVFDDGRILKAQIKYTDQKSSKDSYIVDLRKETLNNGKKRVYTKNEIDVILLYIKIIDDVLWIPPELFDNKQSLSFKIGPTKNNQQKFIRFAKDYIW